MACSCCPTLCPPADPSRPLGAGCSGVELTLTVNRDIPNLEELEQCSHHGRGSGGDAGWGRVPSRPGCTPCEAWANTPSAYCMQEVEREAFLSSLPRNRGSQPSGSGISLLWKEWGEFRSHLSASLSSLSDSLRAQGGAGRGNLSCHLCAHWAGMVSPPHPARGTRRLAD